MIIKEIVRKIEQYDSIVILGHKNPDGDCYGTQIGLKEAILANYPFKKVYAVGSGYSRMIPFIGAMDVVSDEIVHNSLVIAVDFNERSRCEDPRLEEGLDLIVIDHHIANEEFGSTRLIDNNQCACAEIIVNMILELGWKISTNCANALYLGITTDSGRFLYPPIKSSTLKIGAFLIENGADAAKIYDVIYESDESTLEIRKHIYANYKKTKNGLIYISFTNEEIKKLNITHYKATGYVNTLGNIRGLPIWAAFAEGDNGDIRVEVRSTWPIIQPIMKAHGGGGHPHAAGCTAHSFEEIEQIIFELDELISKGE